MEDQSPAQWYEYVQGHLDRLGWNTTDFEDKTGVARQRLNDWQRGRTVSVPIARRIAEVLGRPPMEVFVAAGFLTAEEARQKTTAPADAATLSDEELLREIRRRMRRGAQVDLPQAEVDSKPERYVTAARTGKRRAAGEGDDARKSP